MTETEVESIMGPPDKAVGDSQHKEKFWKLSDRQGQGVFVKFGDGKAEGDIEFGQNPDNFDKVQVGMTQSEVESIVGKPDKTAGTLQAWKIPAIPRAFLVTFTDGKAQRIDVGIMP